MTDQPQPAVRLSIPIALAESKVPLEVLVHAVLNQLRHPLCFFKVIDSTGLVDRNGKPLGQTQRAIVFFMMDPRGVPHTIQYCNAVASEEHKDLEKEESAKPEELEFSFKRPVSDYLSFMERNKKKVMTITLQMSPPEVVPPVSSLIGIYTGDKTVEQFAHNLVQFGMQLDRLQQNKEKRAEESAAKEPTTQTPQTDSTGKPAAPASPSVDL